MATEFQITQQLNKGEVEVLEKILRRTASLTADEETPLPVTFKIHVSSTLQRLLDQEDTDHNIQITTADKGPKVITLGTINSDSSRTRQLRGTYQLANLLETLYLAREKKRGLEFIAWSDITESPVDRVDRKIREQYWDTLTRRLDASLIEVAAVDPKDWTGSARPRVYVPASENQQFEYYSRIAAERPELDLDVQYLPAGEITKEFEYSLRDKPGLLALEMEVPEGADPTDITSMRGLEFLVPGGRFNESYYWDSHFIALGLLEIGRTETVKHIMRNFIFQIEHYGKVLNANRSYYLTRSQPPFLTDLAMRLYNATKDEPDAVGFLRMAIRAAVKEYMQVWMAEPRYDPVSGLSRFGPPAMGIPPEVEEGHFDWVLKPYAERYRVTVEEFIKRYNEGTIKETELDEVFRHDRAVRESGHDTSNRFASGAANLATVDLNCLLYKYETDIAHALEHILNSTLSAPNDSPSEPWTQRAALRRTRMMQYLWSEEHSMFLDYNTATQSQSSYEYVTALYTLWSGVATPTQAALLVKDALPKFEHVGGLACCTLASRGPVSPSRPQRQWDYPYGWAPHQMLAWEGLRRYGYIDEMERLAYRWLQIVTQVTMDYNAAVTEKYDVTQLENPARAESEYGNQGLLFKGANLEGFGWTNASFSYGLKLLRHNRVMIHGLNLRVPYDKLKMKK
ncbi:trehalase-domain-containing protein [Aspergillus pseudoustus]|uniref:Trehalase n=1 Tax=Aspergillus pseudoustus TaxID=1810923 RepID=A0ABR4K4E0_9EURO